MAFSAAFTGAILAPVINMGISVIAAASDIRFPQFPKDVFDEDYEDKFEEDVVIDVKKKKAINKVQTNESSDNNRRNNKFSEFSTTEDSINVYEF